MFVVNVESLKATSLIHAGKFSKLVNTTTSTSTPTAEDLPSDKLKETQEEVAEEKVSPVHNNASGTAKKVSMKRLTGQL